MKQRNTNSVKLDARLLAAVDELAERKFCTKTQIVREAILKELETNGLSPAPTGCLRGTE